MAEAARCSVSSSASLRSPTGRSVIERSPRNIRRSHCAGSTTLVVSPANDERRALNESIRAQLKSEGLLGNRDYAATLLVSLDLTGAQRARATSYQPGDVIRYSRGIGCVRRARSPTLRVASPLVGSSALIV